MYYTVVEDRHGNYVYTGMDADLKDGLLDRTKDAFPQYNNLKVIKRPGERKIPNKSESELIF
ncbi:MAG: hypothetical protein WA125_17570 [Desulfosporosinus sp.]